MSIHFSQWNQSCAFIWAAQVRIRLADLPPKLPPKGVGTGQHDAALLCIHGTKYVLSLGTKYHKTQQNNTVTHKLWISHNPEVAGSSPVPATNKSSLKRQVSTNFFLHYGKSGNDLVTLTPKWPQNGKMTAPGRLNFSTVRALLWINFAELAGKYRSGQPAWTSTGTLFCGRIICSSIFRRRHN